MLAKQIGHHDAVLFQAGGAGTIKIRRIQHRTLRMFIVQVRLNRIEAAVICVVVDKVQCILLDDMQAFIVRRQLEHGLANSDDGGIQSPRL